MKTIAFCLLGLVPAILSHSLECPASNNVCTPVTCEEWSYEGNTGPSFWGTLTGHGAAYALCGTGTSQSPINILTQNATRVNLGGIKFSHGYKHKIFGSYLNEGVSAKFIPLNVADMLITGGPLGADMYQLAQFHFHWGCTDDVGSEHTIDGKRHSMEMHLVHWKTSYGTFASAKTHPDGLAVLAVLFEADHDNHDYDALDWGTETVECVRQPNSTFIGHINLGKFIKTIDADHYFTYPGSLTTPGCDQIVIWTVFPRIITINTHQLRRFRELKTCNCTQECNNFRPVQPLGTRIVRYNKH